MIPSNTPYAQTRWSLVDLFPTPDGPEFEAAFQSIDGKLSDFVALRPVLTANISIEAFLEALRRLEEIDRLTNSLLGYTSLWLSEDTQNQAAISLNARVDQYLAEVSNRVLFFTLWWKDLDDSNAQRLIAASGDYAYWLEAIRHFKPHTLTEAEEKILNIKNVTGASALNTLYSSITNRYTFKLEVDGQTRELTRGEIMVFARHHDPDVRARAYRELYRVFSADGPILGQMYQVIARDWRNEEVGLRHYASPIAARNLANDIPDEVVDTLLEVCQKNAPVFQRYFKLKARWLGQERLRRYDIYAPVARSNKQYDFLTATSMVFGSFTSFEPRLVKLAQRVFSQNHLDSEVRKGKRGGAFCATVNPGLTPWVLLNYQGRPEDVATMAHELGHAIHSMLAADHTSFTHQASLPLAETASTFGEMLLVDRLLKEEQDAAVRRDLLFKQVDDAYATILRQAFFAIFEQQAHEMVQNNASVDELAEAYLGNLKQQFGDAVEVSDEFRWEWVSIPHIYNVPFYVYAYTFGQLLVLALYQQYQAEGEAFKPRYLKILSAGGSIAPVRLLADAGIDIRTAQFWQGGFDIIGDLVSQLEELPLK